MHQPSTTTPQPRMARRRPATRAAVAAACALAGSIAAPGLAELPADVRRDGPDAGMLRHPDVSATHIVFSYANDLWLISRAGGTAVPVSSPSGRELQPRFSPDGSTIAFMGNYDTGRDLFTIPVAGGVATRVTHHPASEVLCDWTPAGRLLFAANGITGNPRAEQLLVVDAEGGMPEVLPVPYGEQGALSADGRWLAYTPYARDNRTWKRYRGGMASDVWLFDLEELESVRVTDWEGTDSQPMWHDGMLYYVSDAGPEHRTNIWSYDPETGRKRQVTRFEDYDVKTPAVGPGPNGQGEIVFQCGSDLYLLDLRTKRTRVVEVSIPGDRPTLRTKVVDPMDHLMGGDVSATGVRAVLEARGDLFTVPAEHGSPRALTRTSGVAERNPSWSPDGRWIAYFSDESGEYELYVTQSDGKGETRQVTGDGEAFRFNPIWAQDSQSILTSDVTGAMYHHDLESGETTLIDVDPLSDSGRTASFTQDGRWITYARSTEDSIKPSIFIHDLDSGETHQVTTNMTTDLNPVFDRRGDYLYYVSARAFSPSYGNYPGDTTFVYEGTHVLIAVPLRADIESPFLPESDEETWDQDDEETSDDEAAEDDDTEGPDDEGDDAEDAEPRSPIHGTWEGTLNGLSQMGLPPEMDSIDFTMTIIVSEEGTITGSTTVMGQSSSFDSITFDESTGEFVGESVQDGVESIMRGTLDGESIKGTWDIPSQGISGTWEASKSSDEADEDAVEADEDEPVEIDLEGFEARSMMLPVERGTFGQLGVNDKNELLYVRQGSGGNSGVPTIMLYDIDADEPAEKTVVAGAGGFALSGDGKKMLVLQGNRPAIRNASAGGSGKPVQSAGMRMRVDPRAEWRQIFMDTWRIFRDYFYVENMHGVDWVAVRDQYLPMVDDCVSRDDLNHVIGEMIAELNVGHAYRGGGDLEGEAGANVGLLGADLELNEGTYRIARIHRGGPWDLDAKGPLSQPGVDVAEGDYLHAVNGMPLSPDVDPWSALEGLAGRTVTLTVSSSPDLDAADEEDVREVLVEPLRSENDLRYRSWIESNRRYVDERTDGRVGYIYVPNTGIVGQNDLFRQFYAQMEKDALIIDERWNGGGQIPTRFIELLNRPRTNYWARRHGTDWPWPPDSHQGPKCMLINGLAGSGGDMFPALFRQADLGPLIGTRTWGGLVGISGNPGPIDGGFIAVPTFGFYEVDGTWGIEGHGVDPDYEVIDDPALMVDGGDPQLDKAIELMLEAIEENPYQPPTRPADPDRSGMGLPDRDK